MKGIKAVFLAAALAAATGGSAARLVLAQTNAQNPESSGAAQTPAAPTPTSATPSTAETASSSPPQAAAPVSMDPNDVRALLYKVYTAAYRITDLASTLQPGNLKISDQDRATLTQKLDGLRAALAALEKPRGEFYNHPDSGALGRETLSAMKALLTQIQGFETALAESAGVAEAILDYQQPVADLAGLANRLEPYVGSLEGTSAPPAPGAAPSGTSQTPTAPALATAGTASSAPQTSVPAPSVSVDPNDVRALLYKIYTTAYRVTDLAATLQPSSLKISDQDRVTLGQKLDALRAALAALEKPRGEFYNHPESEILGRETLVALKTLLPQVDDFKTALAKSADAAQPNDYQQPAADLAALASQLEPYVNYLEASAASPAATARAGGAEMKTEEIQAPTAFVPITSTSTVKPPLDPNELKQLLYKAYVPAFRIKDLLGQERPERWHASEAEQGAFNSARQALEQRLAEFDTLRGQFVRNPQSLEDAFQTYRALWSVLPPLETVSRSVGQNADPQAGAEYRKRGQEMAEVREKLEPYINYLLKYHDQTVQTSQQNLIACENQLGYAMRPRAEAAVPMKNIIPVFQGARVREREAASKSHSSFDTPKENKLKKKSTKPASSPVH